MSQRISLILAVAAVLAVLPVFGQNSSTAAIPAGTFVLSENGPTFSALARLSIGSAGEVTGLSLVRASTTTTGYAIQGVYTINADSTSSLSLNATSLDANVNASDGEEAPVIFSEHLTLIGPVRGQFATIRTDAGVYATGSLAPAATAVPQGDYFLYGTVIDPGATSIAYLSFDGAGNVTGRQLTNSFGNMTLKTLSGTHACEGNGFQKLTVSAQTTDANGDPVVTTETYAFLATKQEMRMIHADHDGQTGVCSLSQ